MMPQLPKAGGRGPERGRSSETRATRRVLLELLGVSLLFFGGYLVTRPDPLTHIVVTEETVRDLVSYQADLRGQPLDDAEVPSTVEAYLDDEVLVREAFRQGVDRGDPRVRAALLGAVRLEVAGGSEIDAADPAPEALEEFFRRDPDRYRRSETVTLDVLSIQVASLTEAESARILAELRAGTAPQELTGPNGQFSTMRTITASMLSRAYGRAVGVPVFRAEVGYWHGPLGSMQGNDFVRVVDRQSPPRRDFEEVVQLVEQDWRRSWLDDAVEEALGDIRRRYRVELPEGGRE